MAAGPNALRGSGPNPSHAFEDAMTQAGSPDPRNDRVCITSSCPRQFLVTSACRQLHGWQQPRLLESLAAHHHGPRHACDFVSKCNGSDLDRSTPHQTSERKPFCAVLARISDDGHGVGDEQPAQMSIALLRDAPRLSLPPVECSLGTNPLHAARLRPDENVFQSPTSVTSAVATIGPTPGF